MVQAAREQIRNVNTEELRELLAKHRDLVLIDVRMADEIASLGGRIDAGFRTYNINRGWLEFRTEALIPDKSTPVVVYCGINQRSPLAAPHTRRNRLHKRLQLRRRLLQMEGGGASDPSVGPGD